MNSTQFRSQARAFLYAPRLADPLAVLLDTDWAQGCDRVLTHSLDPLLDQPLLVAGLVHQFATVAAELWPAWYGEDFFRVAHDSAEALLNRYACLDLRARGGINLPWLKAAVSACQRGQIPAFTTLDSGLQLGQLALAIEQERLGVAIALNCSAAPAHRLLALAKTMPWLADKIQAQVAVLMPAALAHHPELETLLYAAVTLAAPVPAATEEATHILHPVRGRPHPFSPGEQALFRRLSQDEQLAALFQFNQPVETVRHSRYLVDLLWAQGRVVVEVDGYRYHGDRLGFSRDRQRDYELLISGYAVLRLTHDEVVDDVELAVEKIRDVVQFRQSQCR